MATPILMSRQQALDMLRNVDLIREWAQGREVEVYNQERNRWEACAQPDLGDGPSCLRVRVEQTVALGESDVDMRRDMIRFKRSPVYMAAIMATTPVGIHANGAPQMLTWLELKRDAEISRDGGKTWVACEKKA